MAGGGVVVERAVLDGKMVGRWTECDLLKRRDLLNRVGTREEEFRKEMGMVGVADGGGGVLGYL